MPDQNAGNTNIPTSARMQTQVRAVDAQGNEIAQPGAETQAQRTQAEREYAEQTGSEPGPGTTEAHDEMPADEEGLTAPTSSDVGKQTLTKRDLGGKDVTKDEGALEEAIERGKEDLADDLPSEEDAEGYNPDAEVVERPPEAAVVSEPEQQA